MAADSTRTRTVVVIRHAKAQDMEHSGASTDHERSLTTRGRADAAAVGELLATVLDPDAETLTMVSSAARAVETWEQVAAELDAVPEARVLDELYEAGGNEVVDLLALLDDDVHVAVVVGHNPTIQAVVHQLDNRDDEDLTGQLDKRGLSTASVALLELDGPWSGIEPGSCRLVRLEVPRADH
ncbi:MAG: histidine phosphatase family protein [Nocardioidaceae bacterium]|nr:histidine phosphatase family protein [Nocardioidaceae bacterium]